MRRTRLASAIVQERTGTAPFPHGRGVCGVNGFENTLFGPNGWIVLVLLVAVTAPLAYALKAKRLWLPFYVVTSFAVTIVLVYLARLAGFDHALAALQGHVVVWLAGLLGITSQASSSGVIVTSGDVWSQLEIGIECSAVLELSVLVGLVMCYPAYRLGKRLRLTAWGLLATLGLNLARLLLIVVVVAAWASPSAVFIAHAILGRAVFFSGVVIIYWYLLTRTTLVHVVREMNAR